MSGRSGYGRSRIVGKIIHKPANMMMAGLAPKVGKPGWAIRLYYQRINETMTSSVCEPIKIIKRLFISGNSILNANLIQPISTQKTFEPDNGLTNLIDTTQTQAYYAIVYNRKLGWTNHIVPLAPAKIKLVHVNNANANTANGTTIAELDNNDFLVIPDSQQWGPEGKAFNINLGDQTISGGGTLPTANYGAWSGGGPAGSPNCAWVEVNGGGSFPRISNIFGTGGGAGSNAVIVTNESKLGGYAILINITQILNTSAKDRDNGNGGVPVPAIGIVPQIPADLATDLASATYFRNDLATLTVGTNNIGIKYTAGGTSSGTGTQGNLTTVEDCFGVSITAPIGSFAIAPVTGLPTISDYLTN